MYPVLREDGSSLDWPNGNYQCQIHMSMNRAQFEHRISGADALQDLIKQRLASWVIELRSPAALCVRHFLTHDSGQIEWPPEVVADQIWLIPGLVTVEHVQLDAARLSNIWGPNSVSAPPGAWLARGVTRTLIGLAMSLLAFKRDGKLRDGEMSVEIDVGEPRFIVRLASDVFRRRMDRDIQMAGLIGACAMLKSHPKFADDSENVVANQLRALLNERNLAHWLDPEFDAAATATAIEKFHTNLQTLE